MGKNPLRRLPEAEDIALEGVVVLDIAPEGVVVLDIALEGVVVQDIERAVGSHRDQFVGRD